MPIDSAPITGRAPDDITSIIADILSGIQYKFLTVMFISYIVLNSDGFINRVLATFDGAVEFKALTSWGVTLSAMMLVIVMIAADGLINRNVI